MYVPSMYLRAVSSVPPEPWLPAKSLTRGSQSSEVACADSFAFSPGWSSQKRITLCCQYAWNAHSSTCWTGCAPKPHSWNAADGVFGEPAGSRASSIQRPCDTSAYVCGLFAFQSAFESVSSVTQPSSTLLRTTHGVTATTEPARTATAASAAGRVQSSRQAT